MDLNKQLNMENPIVSKIFIMGLNAKSGGGKSILNNYLALLAESNLDDQYFVLTPNKSDYIKYSNENIIIVDIRNIFKKLYMVYFRYEFVLPRLIRTLNIDLIINLSDVPIKAKGIKQIFLFDWTYAVYPESIVWKKMDLISFIERKIKISFFVKYLSYISLMVAQTKTVKKRLEEQYNLDAIEILPNAVSIDNMSGGERKDFQLPNGKKLLLLSVYYPHKNFEILLPLAKKIKDQGLDYKIIITIEESQHRKVKGFLNTITTKGLQDIIINIGPVKMQNIPSLYQQCDALLLPTLLESFSGTYVEAMFHRIPIFTSNLDFAIDVCQDAAFYFDPSDHNSILHCLNEAFSTNGLIESKVITGQNLLKSLLSWQAVLQKLTFLIKAENER